MSTTTGLFVQRQEAGPEKPPANKPRQEPGSPTEPESPSNQSGQLLDRLEKLLLPDTGDKVAAGAMAAGAVAALAANHEELPVPVPISLDRFVPGLSLKIGVDGPLDTPAGVSLIFKYKEQGAKRGQGRPSANEAYRAQTARMAADLEMWRTRPAAPAGPYRPAGDDMDRIASSLRASASATSGGLQLTLPPWSFRQKSKPVLGEELKLPVPGSVDEAPELQRRLSVGASDDPLEHEADRIAGQVISSPAPVRGAAPASGIQRAAPRPSAVGATAPASVERVLASAGSALDDPVRQDMEQRFGRDFSAVRVHQDEAAAQSARDVSAEAYTSGSHIVFGSGRFSPRSSEGRRLLAHELTHVVQQGAAASSPPLQRKVIVNSKELGPAERATFLKSRKWQNEARAKAILDDMAEAGDAFDFDDDAELGREIEKRVSTVGDLQKSQEHTGKTAADSRSGFGYPFTGDSILYGPRVNWSARDYWTPKVVDDYKVRTDAAKNKKLIASPRHERCLVYGDPCGLYSWRLTDIGKADPFNALSNLFPPQAPHKRTLLHCDYLVSIVNFMSFAKSIGAAEFNKRVAAFGPDKIVLNWNAFVDLDLTIWERDPSGNIPTDPAKLKVGWGLGSMQSASPSSTADLVIGDHVVFSNYAGYDLINQNVGNAWRLENAILIRRDKGKDIFLGHGSGERTTDQMNAKLAQEYNEVADQAIALTAQADSKAEAVSKPALAKLSVRFPNVKKVGAEWRVQGKDFCKANVDAKLRRIAVSEIPGLRNPCDLSKLGYVHRPIESAPKPKPPAKAP